MRAAAGWLMVAVMADEIVVHETIAPYLDRVSIAGLNAPQSVVVSGEGETLKQLSSCSGGKVGGYGTSHWTFPMPSIPR
ncbi:MAG: hypothetical protein R3E93_04535 [Thiothrix sp.]